MSFCKESEVEVNSNLTSYVGRRAFMAGFTDSIFIASDDMAEMRKLFGGTPFQMETARPLNPS